MLSGHLALTFAALFAGAAIVISLAEQPARLLVDERAMVTQWERSYAGAAPMQATLAFLSGCFGIWAFLITRDWRWLAGAALILANWPYTFVVIMPVNNRLHELAREASPPAVRPQVERWGRLHMGRSALGVFAVVFYLWALH